MMGVEGIDTERLRKAVGMGAFGIVLYGIGAVLMAVGAIISIAAVLVCALIF